MGKNNKVEPTFLFNSSFERFVRYRRSFPSQYPDADNHPNLAAWVEKQRVLFKAGKLPVCRKEVLDDFGFDWGVPAYDNNCTDDQWYEQCKKWVQVQKEQQKLAAQPAGEEQAPKEEDSILILSRWIKTQHEARARRELCPHRQAFLKSIGFFKNIKRRSNYSAEAWNIMYAELEKHHATHGHSKVSATQYNKLAKWISDQRRKFHGSIGKGLEPDREAKLRKLGVDLDTPLAGHRTKKKQKTRASVDKADAPSNSGVVRETKRARRESAKEVAKSYYYGDESSKVDADEKEDKEDGEDEATGGAGEEEAQEVQNQKAASTSHADDSSVGLFQDDLDSSDEEDEETDNQGIAAGEDETQNASKKRARRASMTLKSYAEDLSDLSSNAVEKAGKDETQDVSKRARRASMTVKSYAEDLSDLSSNAVKEAGKDETQGESKRARRASMKVKSYAEDFSDLSSTGSV